MTDDDETGVAVPRQFGITANIAEIRTSVGHIEKRLDAADRKQEQIQATMGDVRERLKALETQRSDALQVEERTDVPGRMRVIEQSDAVQDAVRQERADWAKTMRATVFGGVAAAGTLAGLIVLIGDGIFGN